MIDANEWPCVQRCGTCASREGQECWSMDRLDNDRSRGPAGYVGSREGCEAWMPTRPIAHLTTIAQVTA